MSMTVAEKEHWKSRINSFIDKEIKNRISKEDPSFLSKVDEEAARRSDDSFGITALEKEKLKLENTIEKLGGDLQDVTNSIALTVMGMDSSSVRRQQLYDIKSSARTIRIQNVNSLKPSILAETELGKGILKLRREQDSMLDTVWLATTTKQIKEVWAAASSLLGVSMSELEAGALKMDPPEGAE